MCSRCPWAEATIQWKWKCSPLGIWPLFPLKPLTYCSIVYTLAGAFPLISHCTDAFTCPTRPGPGPGPACVRLQSLSTPCVPVRMHGLSPGTYEAVRPRLLCRFRPLVIKLKRVHSFIQSCGKHFLSACPVPGTGNWRYKNEGLTFAHVKPQPRAKD